MARARTAAVAALVLILALGATALAAPGVPPGDISAQAVVVWPPSTGLVIAEVVTGGASASDEYVELANASSAPIDLAGLEIAYVTSTGGTVTRKATWPATTLLEPGRHLLIANASGIYGAVADATYSGGFAATGGALVARPIGGQPIDAVGWGDATSAFVEGTAAPAPATGSSIERGPGGSSGNATDTNDNAADFVVNGAPVAQNLAAAPVPSATPSASPSPTPGPTPTPTPSASPSPSPTATPTTAASPTPNASPSPTRTPSPSPTPSATATPVPSATATPSPTAIPTPSPSPRISTIGAARLATVGSTMTVRGVVVAEAGRLGTPAILVIADDTGGLPVRLPDGVSVPVRGALLEVRGVLADPYGQVELRAPTGGVTILGTGVLPAPAVLDAGAIGEASEGRLVRVTGTIAASAERSTSNDITFSITGSDGATLKVLADASAGIDPSILRKGVVATFTGVSGQRATHKGAQDGYRLWLRDRADVVITSQPSPSPSPTRKPTPTPKVGPTPKPSTSSSTSDIPIRNALLRDGQRVTVEGVLTIGTGLLDASGRRAIIEDGTAAIELYLEAPDAALRLGTRVRVTGTVGQAWGAPRLRADETHVLGSRQPTVHAVRSAPTAAVEWRLVKLDGTVADVHRNGDRWSAELQIAGGAKVPVSGLAGSGIPSTAMIEGRTASVIGIVKRPYPTATDRRFALVPRRASDVVLGKPVATPIAGTGTGASSTGATGGATTAATGAPIAGATGSTLGAARAVVDVDLRDIAAHVGKRVRVGGLVTDVGTDGVRLDDGTSGALLVLEGDATDLLTVLEPGDALNAIGTPDQRGETVLVVADAADIELVGDLGADPASTDGVGLAAAVVDDDPRITAQPTVSADASTPAAAPFAVGAAILAVLVVTAAVAPLLARRHRARRALQARIAGRLEALRRAPEAASGGPDQAMSAPIGAQSGPELGGNVPGTA